MPGTRVLVLQRTDAKAGTVQPPLQRSHGRVNGRSRRAGARNRRGYNQATPCYSLRCEDPLRRARSVPQTANAAHDRRSRRRARLGIVSTRPTWIKRTCGTSEEEMVRQSTR
jgi:hypothetical protein